VPIGHARERPGAGGQGHPGVIFGDTCSGTLDAVRQGAFSSTRRRPNRENLTGKINASKHILNALIIHHGDRHPESPMTITTAYTNDLTVPPVTMDAR
jgi:hypothetical protein